MYDIKKEGDIIKKDNINGNDLYYETFKNKQEFLEDLYCLKKYHDGGEELTIDDIDKRPFVLSNDIKTYNELLNPGLDDRIHNLVLELQSDKSVKK